VRGKEKLLFPTSITKLHSEIHSSISGNGLQPYADAKGWQVRWGICVKGAVSGVRWVVREPVSILLKTIFCEGIKSLNHKLWQQLTTAH